MKNLMTVVLLILSIGLLSALEFDPDYFYSRSIIACFTKEAVGNDSGVINFTTETAPFARFALFRRTCQRAWHRGYGAYAPLCKGSYLE
jgi:hypothetical protein